ncbi:hypothetical protein Tco_0684331 [Tanacetum coccineum]
MKAPRRLCKDNPDSRCMETSMLLCSESLTLSCSWIQKIVSQLAILVTIVVNTSNVHVSAVSSSLSTASTTDNTAKLMQLALLSMKARKFYQRTGKKIIINGSDTAGYDKTKLAIDGVGWDLIWSFMTEEEVPTNFALMAFSDSEASKSLDKLIGCQISDNNRKGVGYNVVAPPPTGLFPPPSIDLSNSGLEEFKQPKFEGYGVKVNKSVSENSSNEIKKTSGASIIKDWVSDCDEDETLEMVSESANVQRPKQADQPRKVSQNHRNNSTNWNTPMSKKLRVGFQFTPKACFVCGSFNHLIKEYDFHDKKMVQKPVLNNVKKGTGQREVRPVWNNAMRTNHQNFSNSRRNFAPTAVLTKFGLVPISTARQSSSRAAASVSTVRPIKTVAPKSFENVAKTRPNAFQKLHSPSRRPFYQQTALKNRNLNNKVNTVKVNFVNTAKGKRVTSDVGEQGINVVKSKACWVWRPKIKTKSVKHIGKSKEVGTLRYLSLVVPLTKVGDEVVHKELGDRMERAVTTASSFKTEQYSDSGPRGYTPGSDEGSEKLNELTELCTKLSEKVISLEQDLKQTKQVYGKALTKLGIKSFYKFILLMDLVLLLKICTTAED